MAIDLVMTTGDPIVLSRMVNETRNILMGLLNGSSIPLLEVSRIIEGRSEPACETIFEDDALYSISYVGLQDRVWITSILSDNGRMVTVSVGSTREPSEYVLGLACALAIANMARTEIEDAFSFWTGNRVLLPSEIIPLLTIKSRTAGFQDDCLTLVGKRLD